MSQIIDRFRSEVATHSFFITDMGEDRFSIPVLSLAMNPDSLFDYDAGIQVAGVDFDTWRQNNPNSAIYNRAPANYQRRGRQWEVPANFEFFPGEGSAAVNMELGARIHGNSSRVLPLKSMRFFARRTYDEINTISYPFFSELKNSVTGEVIDSYERLMLRNSGVDYFGTMTRDALVQRILSPIGVDYQEYEPAIVLINGEFWGIMNLRERISKEYFTARHSIEPDDVARLEFESNIVDGPANMRTQYISMRSQIINQDMSRHAL